MGLAPLQVQSTSSSMNDFAERMAKARAAKKRPVPHEPTSPGPSGTGRKGKSHTPAPPSKQKLGAPPKGVTPFSRKVKVRAAQRPLRAYNSTPLYSVGLKPTRAGGAINPLMHQ